MEWGKIKTILICLFLAINLFLAWNLFYAQRQKYQIAPNLLDDVVEVLRSKQVQIAKELVPQKRIVMRGFLFSPSGESYSSVADRILKEYIISKEDAQTTFSNGQNLLVFSGQNNVCFTGIWKQYKYPFDANGVKDAAQKFLGELCDNDLAFSLEAIIYDPIERIYTIDYKQMMDQIDILNAHIRVFVSDEGITQAKGTVLYTAYYPYVKGQFCDSFNSLLQYPLQEDIDNTMPIEILGIKPVYYMGMEDTVAILYAAWEITALDQPPIIFNALTGERMKNT